MIGLLKATINNTHHIYIETSFSKRVLIVIVANESFVTKEIGLVNLLPINEWLMTLMDSYWNASTVLAQVMQCIINLINQCLFRDISDTLIIWSVKKYILS